MEAKENQEKSVNVLDLKIDLHPDSRALIAMEMHDTHKTGFRRKTVSARKKSIDRIFGGVNRLDMQHVDRSKLRGLPRRSLVADLDFGLFNAGDESEDEEDALVIRNNNCVHMLDLRIGEQNPTTNSLVALEMHDTQKTGFRRNTGRKKSIDRIFGRMNKVHIVHEFDKYKLKGMPRRSLASGLDSLAMFREFNESDDDDDTELSPIARIDDTHVKVLDLNIGENEPATKSLVALEMEDTQKTGFKKDIRRKKSIDRIFGKMGKLKVESGIDKSVLKEMPRRSLTGDFDLAMMNDPSESDEE